MILRLIEIAEYAAISNEGLLTIAGIFEGGKIAVPPTPPGAQTPRPALPKFYIVFVVTCSLHEGTEHVVTLRVENADGEPVIDPVDIPVHFVANKKGRQMRFSGVANVPMLPLPDFGDYEIHLMKGADRLGFLPIFVDRADD